MDNMKDDIEYIHGVNQRYYDFKNFLNGLNHSIKMKYEETDKYIKESFHKPTDQQNGSEEYNKRISKIEEFNEYLDDILKIIIEHKGIK